MTSVLYNIAIYPIELFFEIVFSVIYRFRHNAGISIIGISLLINFLLLPLYKRADSISAEERQKQKEMSVWCDHIKKTFRGDERFMILSAWYRKQDYHPLYSLRSTIPLLLQVPFFIAAYHFLSHLTLLNGVGFLWIRDLGQPDQLLLIPDAYFNINPAPVPIRGFAVNLLPILMTVINLISCLIYTKDAPFREKLQLYAMALLFLFLLYRSPSGLVLYWTMNNVFSLVKSIFIRPGKEKPKTASSKPAEKPEGVWALFIGGAVFLTVLTGIFIPSTVISASPSEFVSLAAYKNPLQYILFTLSVAAGTFLLWSSILLLLLPPAKRKILSLLMWLSCGIASVNFFLFGKNTVNLSPELQFDHVPVFPLRQILWNALILAIVCGLCFLAWKKFRHLLPAFCGILILSLLCGSGAGILRWESVLKEEISSVRSEGGADAAQVTDFMLSTKGKNVIVIMLDRAIGGYVPFIFSERPDLLKEFAGFTYYPNTISFGAYTNFGAPALFGGYEYTTAAINSRPEETLVEKHDDALRVMPVLFSSKGYQTTVYDPPYANYKELRDLSIYDEWPEITAAHIKESFVDADFYALVEKNRKRSFFMYSVYKISPLFLHDFLYNKGYYNYADVKNSANLEFDNDYAVLENLPLLTDISDTDRNTFMIMDNECTHDTCELQLPGYVPSAVTNNTGLESGYRTDSAGNILTIDPEYHYHDMMATFIKLGEWFDYLKENDVYDNTRIILVSDHGRGLGQFETLIQADGTDMEWVYPLLMVKDFNSTEFSVSDEFMTNADTPFLASKDLIKDPLNPFTGNAISDQEKRDHDQLVVISDLYDILNENTADMKTFDTHDGVWYSIHDNIFNRNNWTRVK